MSDEPSSQQSLHGRYNAQADHGATANVNVYQNITHAEIPAETIKAALDDLAELPTEHIPEVTALPPRSRMPFAPNPTFVGREADLKQLAVTLKSGGTAAVGQIAAATGLGGIGKTQLASEFVHRYGHCFSGGVFWLSFADPTAIPAEIAACGGAGGLETREDFSSLPLEDQVRLVLSAWVSELPRLLVFDNCEDEALLMQWRPPSGGGRILVTSRRTQWSTALAVKPLPLGVLTPAESLALLRKFRPDLSEADSDWAAIAESLGCLPLALHLAGSFLKRYQQTSQGTPAAYLARLQQPDLLAHRSMIAGEVSPTGHELHVAKTFALSFDQLHAEVATDALALDVLARLACFAPGEPIPRALLVASLALAADDEEVELQVEDALHCLDDLGLLNLETGGDPLLHRLLQVFVQQASTRYEAAHAAVEQAVLDEANQINNAGYPAPLLAWQPHLRAVAEAADARTSDTASALLNSLGWHFQMVADYGAARDCYARALKIDETAFGPDHPNVATDVNNLGGVLKDQGDLVGARDCFERALKIGEAAFGPDHPKVATYVNNLGLVLQDQGDLNGARDCFARALKIDEAAFGPDHPNVARDVNNLGLVLQAQGDLVGARDCYERAIKIDETAFGPDHPNVATDVNNLGLVLKDQGDLVGARDCFERALKINEAAFGPDHPNVATDVNNLGLVLQDQGDLDGARDYFERAIKIDEAAFGPDHPNVATDVNNLGGVLKDQGDLDGAHDCLERALAILEMNLGADHPNTQLVKMNLAFLGEANEE